MTSETNTSTDRAKSRGALIALAALFFLPLLGSFWLYYIGGWRPAGSTNNGELISPVRQLSEIRLQKLDGTPLDAESFSGKWTFVYIDAGNCDETCRNALWAIRQTRLLLAQDMDRVNRVFVAETACCDREFLAAEHPGLQVVEPSPLGGAASLAVFPREAGVPYVYIVDPLGNLIMRFDTRQNPKGLLVDIEKLLKLSHIG